ncbi:MAG: protein translocase subunit SecD [Microthrixaceae bacterium]
MRKHPLRLMIATMVVAYGLLLVTVLSGRSPTLGLDLQGGISVNLQPVKDGKVTNDVTSEQLDQAIGIIRKRVDALGVAEPEVSRQGSTILIQLPGAKDQQQVLDVLGKTAELRFRPVLQDVGRVPTGSARSKAEQEIAKLRGELKVPEGVTAQQVLDDEQAKTTAAAGGAADQAQINSTTPTTAAPSTTAAPPTTAAPGTTIDPTSGSGGNRSAELRRQGDGTTDTVPGSTPASTTTTVPPTPVNQWGVNLYDAKFRTLYQLETQLQTQTTPPAEDKADAEVTLKDKDGNVVKLGPTLLTGTAVETATAGLNQQGEWTVNPVFRKGADGIDKFNEVAAKCFSGAPECPASGGGKGRLAIVLDGDVLSAPSINESSFKRDQIQISGSFTEEEAKNLAVALRFGALPIELQPQQAETVSATLGKGALQAGIIAGLVGLALVCAYMVLYYKELGLATIGSLSISASLLWVVMSNLNATVTLAGLVGIVVSIGITMDSSVVFFESLKEDVRNGASLRSAADKSFSTAYATIVKADMSSLIGAVVLYWLSVGPVRGFAFYLGVATLLDLISAYFFLRPAVVVLSRSSQGEHPKRFGIPVDDLPDGGAAAGRRSGARATAPVGAAVAGSGADAADRDGGPGGDGPGDGGGDGSDGSGGND